MHSPGGFVEVAVSRRIDTTVDPHAHTQPSKHKGGSWLVWLDGVPFGEQRLTHLQAYKAWACVVHLQTSTVKDGSWLVWLDGVLIRQQRRAHLHVFGI